MSCQLFLYCEDAFQNSTLYLWIRTQFIDLIVILFQIWNDEPRLESLFQIYSKTSLFSGEMYPNTGTKCIPTIWLKDFLVAPEFRRKLPATYEHISYGDTLNNIALVKWKQTMKRETVFKLFQFNRLEVRIE